MKYARLWGLQLRPLELLSRWGAYCKAVLIWDRTVSVGRSLAAAKVRLTSKSTAAMPEL